MSTAKERQTTILKLVRVPSVARLAVTPHALYGRTTTRTNFVKKPVRARMTQDSIHNTPTYSRDINTALHVHKPQTQAIQIRIRSVVCCYPASDSNASWTLLLVVGS